MHDFVHGRARSVSGDDVIVLDGINGKPSEKKICKYALLTNFDVRPMKLSNILAKDVMALLLLGCSKLVLSDDSFSFAEGLRVLHTRDPSMKKLPGSICRLTQLRYLNLSGCSGLAELPELFRMLKKLKYLDLSGCSGLAELPISFRKLEKLEYLDLSGCSGLVKLPISFGILKKLEYLDLSGCSGLVKLPISFVMLENLKRLDLSGCSGLVELSESFQNLGKLKYLDLSGCSGLVELSESFQKLEKLEYLNLSGCSGLVKLPVSFGMLEYLEYLDLSGCSGLVKLPVSFGMLEYLEYLDLSGCSCLQGIQSALGGLTNLQHLNLSHPCCYLAEHRFHLECLKDVWGKLTNLRYLNLSMCLNPILCYMTEEERIIEYIGSISLLSSLEHLDLSHNIFLFDLPESLGDLSHLHTLDLSGCTRLKRVNKRITEINSLKDIVVRNCRFLEMHHFVVRAEDVADSSSNLVQLSYVENCKELEISCLEKVKSVEEAKRIMLSEKQTLQKLTLAWTEGSKIEKLEKSVDGKALLEALAPPQNLQRFGLHGYREECLPAWLTSSIWSHLPNLVDVTMEDIPRCSALPPLFLLPNLKKVVLRRMASITRIDAGELSGKNRAAVRRLLRFILDDLANLQVFNTIYRSGDTEFMFPIIDELVIQSCPNVKFGPFPPQAQRLQISACDQLMSSLPKRERGEGQGVQTSSSSTSTTSARVTQLVVEKCKVPLSHWSLLHHLPGLRRLEIRDSNDLTGSPEIIQVLSSLQSLCFSQCDGMTALPEHLGDLTSLWELDIHGCQGIKYLPQSIYRLINLKNLRIRGCPELKRWCELEENKKKLAHIQAIYEESDTVEPDTTANPTANKQLTLSQSNVSVTH